MRVAEQTVIIVYRLSLSPFPSLPPIDRHEAEPCQLHPFGLIQTIASSDFFQIGCCQPFASNFHGVPLRRTLPLTSAYRAVPDNFSLRRLSVF